MGTSGQSPIVGIGDISLLISPHGRPLHILLRDVLHIQTFRCEFLSVNNLTFLGMRVPITSTSSTISYASSLVPTGDLQGNVFLLNKIS